MKVKFKRVLGNMFGKEIELDIDHYALEQNVIYPSVIVKNPEFLAYIQGMGYTDYGSGGPLQWRVKPFGSSGSHIQYTMTIYDEEFNVVTHMMTDKIQRDVYTHIFFELDYNNAEALIDEPTPLFGSQVDFGVNLAKLVTEGKELPIASVQPIDLLEPQMSSYLQHIGYDYTHNMHNDDSLNYDTILLTNGRLCLLLYLGHQCIGRYTSTEVVA